MEAVAVVGVPAVLGVCALAKFQHTALLSMLTVLAALMLSFGSFEAARPRLRDVMPVAVLAALAAAGRIMFAAVPSAKPVSAVAIIAGIAFGRRSGFMVGALAALASNFFFGQGPWTPWQMYAWGMVGYGAGLLANTALFTRKAAGGECGEGAGGESAVHGEVPDDAIASGEGAGGENTVAGTLRLSGVCAYGFASGLGYGVVLNTWSILGFFHPQTFAQALAVYAAAAPFDIMHGVATVVFLALLCKPLVRKLFRMRMKYNLLP